MGRGEHGEEGGAGPEVEVPAAKSGESGKKKKLLAFRPLEVVSILYRGPLGVRLLEELEVKMGRPILQELNPFIKDSPSIPSSGQTGT